jgi:hypothetical protein
MSAERPVTDLDYELLSAYLDGALSDSQRSALESRLQDDPVLRRELEAMRQTVALVNQLSPLKAPRDFTLDPSRIRAVPQRLLVFPTTAAFSALSAAAAVLLLALAGFLLLSRSSADLAQPQAAQQIAANPTVAITNEEGFDQPGFIAPSPSPLPAATDELTSTQAVAPVAAPGEALGRSAADEQLQEAESADSALSLAQPTPSSEPLAAIPALEAPAAGGFAEGAAQDEIAAEESGQTAPLPAPQATYPADITSFAFAPTAPEDAGSRAADNRFMIQETATSLSETLSIAQAQVTTQPERERDDDVSPTQLPATSSPPLSTPAPVLDGLLEREQQGSSQSTLANVLLAVGLLLLIISAATTLARRRR